MSNNVFGNPYFAIKRGFVKQVLMLLADGAQQLRANGVVTPETREDSISNGLDRQMRELYKDSDGDIVSWSLRGVHTVPEEPSITFSPDFSFRGDWRPRNQAWYLGVEAKRLRGAGDSLAGDYVRQGVMRFIDGQYSRGHDYAVMLGYVVVPTLTSAVARVQAAMTENKKPTQQVAELASDPEICQHDYTYVSRHGQHGAVQDISLVHLFFDFCQQ